MALLLCSLCLVLAVGVVLQLAHGSSSSSQPVDKSSTSTTTTSTVTNNTATTRQRMLNLHEKNIFQYLEATRSSSGGKTTTTKSTSGGNGTFQADELDADFRIVGGTAAPAGKYPFYVNTLRPILCGGTLIHPDIVLTAARTFFGCLLLPLLLL
jgi:hypothetical protein